MRKIMFILLLCISLFCCNCSSYKDYGEVANELYQKDPNTDFIIVQNTVYINASQILWVKELVLTKNIKIGEIQRSLVTNKYKNFDATVASVGASIYTSKEYNEILLLESKGEYLPYLGLIEG